LKAGGAVGIRMHRLRQHFDRHVTAEPIAGGAIHFAHPARTEQRDDLVSADSRSRYQPHERLSVSMLRKHPRQRVPDVSVEAGYDRWLALQA
jgi:hypothetical protein